MTVKSYLSEASRLFAETVNEDLEKSILAAIETLTEALGAGKSVLICGNGGSAADAMHIAGELVGRFLLDRPAYKAIALGTDPAVTTAWSNDVDYASLFARQVEALGEAGGVLWGLSTSGESENVVRAIAKARDRSMTTIAFTGRGGGRMTSADILVTVPTASTPRVQELHTCLYHYVCEQVERHLAGGTESGGG